MNMIGSIISYPFRQGVTNISVGFASEKCNFFKRIARIVFGIFEIIAIPLNYPFAVIDRRFFFKNKKVENLSSKSNQPSPNDSILKTSDKTSKFTPHTATLPRSNSISIISKMVVEDDSSRPPSYGDATAESLQSYGDGTVQAGDDGTVDVRDDGTYKRSSSKGRKKEGGLLAQLGPLNFEKTLSLVDKAAKIVEKLPEVILSQDPNFIALNEKAAKLKAGIPLTEAEYADARLAQIKAGSLLFDCAQALETIKLHANEYQHTNSMLRLAHINLNQFKQPKGASGFARTNIADEIRIKYLLRSHYWFKKAFEQLTSDQKLYQGHPLSFLQSSLETCQNHLKEIDQSLLMMKSRIFLTEEANEFLIFALAASYQSGDRHTYSLIRKILGHECDHKLYQVMSSLCSHAVKGKFSEKLGFLSYFKKMISKVLVDKTKLFEEAQNKYDSSLKRFQKDGSGVDSIWNELDQLEKLNQNLLFLQHVSRFVENDIPEKLHDQLQINIAAFITQAITNFHKAAKKGSKKAEMSLKTISNHPHPMQALATEKLKELALP